MNKSQQQLEEIPEDLFWKGVIVGAIITGIFMFIIQLIFKYLGYD